MLKIFDMMYYHLATFYQRFNKKTSGWQLQAIFIITITQAALIMDLYLLINELMSIQGKFSLIEKVIFISIVLGLLFYNMKRYEKEYQYYKSIWGAYTGNKKRLQVFLSFFIVVFAWTFIFILGLIFDKY